LEGDIALPLLNCCVLKYMCETKNKAILF